MTRYLYERLRAEVLALRRQMALLLASTGGGGGAPVAHAASHENGGSDEINLTGLTGLGTPGLVWIEEQTPSATGTITFSSLGAFTHLEIRWMARGDTAAVSVDLQIQFSGDTTAVYDTELLYNSTATAAAAFEIRSAAQGTIGTLAAASATANRAGGGTIRIYDYRGTTFDKVATADNHWAQSTSAANILTRLFGVTWRNATPAAVTSVTLKLSAGNFVAGSKFTAYGLT